MRKNRDRENNGKKPLWFYFSWAAPGAAMGCASALMGYVTYYAINILGLSSLLVGGLLLASKLLDGVTDIVAGFIVDHTNTRWGRGRPYDWGYPLLCLFTILFFAIPRMGQAATAVAVFLLYNMIFSVFQTIVSSASAVYLARAVEDTQERVSIGSMSGLITSAVTMVAAIILPPMVAEMGTTREGWTKLALLICVPSMLISIVRFFTIKETASSEITAANKFDIKEGVFLLFHNKYVLIFALALLLTNISSQMSQVNPFFFQYIVGDLSQQSLAGIGSLLGTLSLIFFPALTKRMGLKNLLQAGFVCGIAGRLLPLLNLTSVPLLLVGGTLSGISCMPIFVLSANVVIDCMDYGEWKFQKRGEGIYACVIGFCSKVGIGVASGLVGIITALGGFDSTLAVQSTSANSSIVLLYTVIPAAALIFAMVAMHFYRLEKELPKIRKELAARKKSGVTE